VFQNPIAINAHDPVAYFTESRPVRGDAAHAVDWNGATWYFANAENAATFSANPDAYAPVFGGYCAYAASRGYLADTRPEAWTVYDGKLYLNANLRARELWLRDVPGNIAAGLSNWPGILG
jgi:YHS domain-containing protein